jgi:hypothetical protein
MVIIETSIFTKQITNMMTDEEYRLLQESLIIKPDVGTILKGSGGLRKARWKLEGKGKSGGIRYIYYWVNEDDQIIMLFAYSKSEQETLTSKQIGILKLAIERWKDEK